MTSQINKSLDINDVSCLKISLNDGKPIFHGNTTSTKNWLHYRLSKISSKLSESFKILENLIIILEDLQIKWQAFSINKNEYHAWVMNVNKIDNSLLKDDDISKEKIMFLKNLKNEITKSSSEFTRFPKIGIEEATFSLQLDDDENCRPDDEFGVKMFNQFMQLSAQISVQIENWRNIFQNAGHCYKSDDDLSHFSLKVENSEDIENIPKWNYAKSTSESFCSEPFQTTRQFTSRLRNSGSTRGLSKLFWPYSSKINYSSTYREMNRSLQSLSRCNYNDSQYSINSMFSTKFSHRPSVNNVTESFSLSSRLQNVNYQNNSSQFNGLGKYMNNRFRLSLGNEYNSGRSFTSLKLGKISLNPSFSGYNSNGLSYHISNFRT